MDDESIYLNHLEADSASLVPGLNHKKLRY